MKQVKLCGIACPQRRQTHKWRPMKCDIWPGPKDSRRVCSAYTTVGRWVGLWGTTQGQLIAMSALIRLVTAHHRPMEYTSREILQYRLQSRMCLISAWRNSQNKARWRWKL